MKSFSAFSSLFFLSLLCACNSQPDAQEIVDRAIARHGGDSFESVEIEFDFRDRHYKALHDGGRYRYERSWTDSMGLVHDVLTNDGFSRKVNNQPSEVTDEYAKKYANSVNGVIYFALLPYRLNDPAVIKKYVGDSMIKGEPYYEVQVSFQEEKGGDDHDDIFIYWIHQDTYQMDYLAYEYQRDEGGSRFREAYNQREVGGILFADYVNYEGPYPTDSLANFDELFEQGKLEELSVIETENVEVNPVSQNI